MEERKKFHSMTGAPETEEPPGSSTTANSEPQSQTSAPSTTSSIPQTSNSIPPPKRLYNQTSSATSSPRASRDSSPIRPPLKTSANNRPNTSRSRKNSNNELSPSRQSSTNSTSTAANLPPSNAAVQRGLSAANTPQLAPAVADVQIKAPVPQKPSVNTELKEVPRWPISPRLRSPPPVNRPSSAPRKSDQDVSVINLQKSTPVAESHQQPKMEDNLASGSKPGTRGVSGAGSSLSTLETVEENSQTPTPALGIDGMMDQTLDGIMSAEHENVMDQAFAKLLKTKSTTGANESESEGGGKGDTKLRSTSAAPPSATRPNTVAPPSKSFSGNTNIILRVKPVGEGSTKNMIVETETVSSIPQVAVSGGTGGPGNSGSLRAKPSAETIRPKKEKKKSSTRKTAAVAAGNASSKADIFEAKIASAVDEANSSDSDETFVYESNPPEASDRPRRFHSRTPSATSMASQVDQRGNTRSIHGVLEGVHSVAAKKSMKFANSFHNGSEVGTAEDDGKGTVRSNLGTGRGTTHHHHIGRWGRNGGNGHTSLFDNESLFPNVAKSKLPGNGSRNSSRPSSPRNAQPKTISNGKKAGAALYDIDDGAGADDERTPLVSSSLRSNRGGRRRQPISQRHFEGQRLENPSILNRIGGCLVITIMILLVVSGAIVFMFATTRPLTEVAIVALKKVLASEQEIMLDMQVEARNPNVVVISVDSMDIKVFAKSKHVGDSKYWRGLPPHGGNRTTTSQLRRGYRTREEFVSDPLDPDDPSETNTLLLGHIYDFDSPLLFDSSPFKHIRSVATGSVSLANPGNGTDAGGVERWENVLKYEFELILRGVLRYQLPMNQKVHSVAVDGNVTVKPNRIEESSLGT